MSMLPLIALRNANFEYVNTSLTCRISRGSGWLVRMLRYSYRGLPGNLTRRACVKKTAGVACCINRSHQLLLVELATVAANIAHLQKTTKNERG